MITTLEPNPDTDTLVSQLMRDGAIIVRNAVATDLVDTVNAELRPHYDAQGDRFENDFNGYNCLVIGTRY